MSWQGNLEIGDGLCNVNALGVDLLISMTIFSWLKPRDTETDTGCGGVSFLSLKLPLVGSSVTLCISTVLDGLVQ